ncbi:hypothetical protein Ddye_001888 [Dipteronia dyeriana]|uniref:DUF1985 domain-containing protein n=1 Tax=Dipteronia dyeriana TaxID=168575 RepID=A0AAD9XPD8_9ROSI|nr:hypothetical protein Ddye_001888 [Dipteronia dyeriana]
MSGDESRRLRETSVANDNHHEEPPMTSRRRRGDGDDDDDAQSPTIYTYSSHLTLGYELLCSIGYEYMTGMTSVLSWLLLKENIDYDQFLKVQKNKWTQETLINVGCRLKYICNIKDILRKEGKLAEFMASCFKQFRQFPTNWLFSTQILHNLLLREIKIDSASENELWFLVGGKKARFGQREFCLVTGLWFGEISEIINMPYVANENGIHKRYWPEEEVKDLKLSTVYDRFVASNFLDAEDSLKMTLFLIANNVLFGQSFDKKVTPWLFNLVNDLDAFDGFAWGHYVFKMTQHYLRHGFRSRNSKKGYGKVRYRLYDFPWAVEADVKEILEATDDEARSDYWVRVDYNMMESLQFIPLVEMEMKEKHELLDEGDDGDDGVVGDGDDGAATSKRALKRKEPRSRGGDRITELLEAVRAIPDVLDAVVKQEVSNLPGELRSLVQEIQSSRGQSNQEAPLTVVRDPSLPREEYMSPFIDPIWASVKKLQQDKSKYDQFKRKTKPVRRNVGTEESVDKSFFLWNWKILPSGFPLMIRLIMVLVTNRDEDSLGGCIHNCVFPAVLGN